MRDVPRLGVLPLCFTLAAVAWAQDLTFSAKADKTKINVGDPINLTITLNGDITGITLPAFQFPEAFVVAARSQASEFSFRAGKMERSVSLTYVLIPQQAGTFQLGPFQLARPDKTVSTEPIAITVEKPALPPHLRPQGGRFTL